jgi:hypothetical protein
VHLALALLSAQLFVGAAPSGPPEPAQRSARVEVLLPSPGQRRAELPTVRSVGVLSDRRVRDLLEHGFPARLHYRMELWSAEGWFNDLEERVEWDVIVRYNAMSRSFDAARIFRDQVTPLGTFAQFADVAAAVERPAPPPIRLPTGRRRVYYNLVLDVEMLSVNDLDEVERWLRGELQPAVRGRRNPGTALTRGVRSLIVGLLGGENRHYEARTRTFVPEG